MPGTVHKKPCERLNRSSSTTSMEWPPLLSDGDVVFIFMPVRTTGAERKLQCPNDGPYRITWLWSTGAEVTRLRHKKTIRVALERLRCCSPKLLQAAGLSSLEDAVAGWEADTDPATTVPPTDKETEAFPTTSNSWTRQLRPRVRKLHVMRALQQGGGRCNLCPQLINRATPAQTNACPLWLIRSHQRLPGRSAA